MTIQEIVATVSKEELTKLYIDEQRSQHYCAEYFDITVPQLESVLIYHHVFRKHIPFNDVVDRIDLCAFELYWQDHTGRECMNKFNLTADQCNKLCLYLHLHRDPANNGYLVSRGKENMTSEQRYNAQQSYKDSLIKKYGSLEAGYDYIHQQHKKSVLQKYGVDNVSKCSHVTDKRRKTCISTYGVNVSSKSPVVKQKSADTRIRRYGSLEESYRIGRINQQKSMLSKYGVSCGFELDKCAQARVYKCDSSCNKEFATFLDSHNVTYTREHRIERKLYDFKVGNYLIEVDPYATHNSTWSPVSRDLGLLESYHRDKTLLALSQGFVCVHIYDWTDREFIIDKLIKDKLKIIDTQSIIKHWYNPKTTEHIIDRDRSLCLESEGFVVIYDDGFIVGDD